MKTSLVYRSTAILFVILVALNFGCNSDEKPQSSIVFYLDDDILDSYLRLSDLQETEGVYNSNGQPYTGTVKSDKLEDIANNIGSYFVPTSAFRILELKDGKIVETKYYRRERNQRIHIGLSVREEMVGSDKQTTRTAFELINGKVIVKGRAVFLNELLDDRKEIFFYEIPEAEFIRLEQFFEDNNLVEEKEYSLNGIMISHLKNGIPMNVSLNGEIQTLDESGNTVTTNYKDGKKVGIETSYYNDGTLALEVNHDKGSHVSYFRNGEKRFEAQLIDGQYEGETFEYYKSGDIWKKRNYENGVLHGPWENYYKNGTLGKKGEYHRGRETGEYLEFYENGDRWKKITYKQDGNDVIGHYESWYTNGGKGEVYDTKNGMQHGPYTKWYENETMRIRTVYHKGRKHGRYENWEEDGSLYKDIYYYKNKEVASLKAFKNKVKDMTDFTEESTVRVEGTDTIIEYKAFYENGKMSTHHLRVNGNLNGEYKRWYSSGSLLLFANYKDGLRHGLYQEWFDGESLDRETYFYKDEEVYDEESFTNYVEPEVEDFSTFDDRSVLAEKNYAEPESFPALDRTFNVTAHNCLDWFLPEVDFKLKYPKSIDFTPASEGQQNDNYCTIISRDGESIEEFSIGWLTLEPGSPDWMYTKLLGDIERSYKRTAKSMKTVFKGKRKFYGVEAHQILIEYKFVDPESDSGRLETWKFMSILYPNPNPQKNGLLFLFQANDRNNSIKSFEDFGRRGITGKIWDSFTFTSN